MLPIEKMTVGEIDLSDPAFWRLPEEVIEGAFVTLRRERPMSFHRERALPPLIEEGPGYWAVTKYADIVAITKDTETFCHGKGTVIHDWPEAILEFFRHMQTEDDPRHARLRRIVSRSFTPRFLARMEDDIARASREIVADIKEKGEVEFVSEVAARLPNRMICDLMGVPASMYDFVYEKSSLVMLAGDSAAVFDSDDNGETIMQILQAAADLGELMTELGDDRRANPRDDILSALVSSDVNGEVLTQRELVQYFIMLIGAGSETTRAAIANGMVALSQYPEQRDLWLADFDRHASTAANEIVRWASPVIHMRRTATRDARVGEQQIAEGEKVVLFFRSGNRDEQVFDDPYRFAVNRPDLPAHLGFGAHGPHYCLGAHLARTETVALYRELFSVLPDIHATGEPVRQGSNFTHAITSLQCSFTPR